MKFIISQKLIKSVKSIMRKGDAQLLTNYCARAQALEIQSQPTLHSSISYGVIQCILSLWLNSCDHYRAVHSTALKFPVSPMFRTVLYRTLLTLIYFKCLKYSPNFFHQYYFLISYLNIQLISQNYLVAFYSIDNERKIANLADGEVTEEITNEKPAEKKK